MKKFAIYLPQFHEIKENSEWWGEGFTEWTRVKAGKSLYKGHIQPKEPLNNNYYNLLDEKTVLWQDELLKKYNIDGFIYYHYYFGGKLLLEKPAENLLKNKKIQHKFFFCWPSGSWRKSWNGSSEILIEQNYGGREEWEKHFNYLLKFFKDERYEKRNNKPLFMIHDTEEMRNYPEMFQLFEDKCKENGFDGICLIEVYRGQHLKDKYSEFKKKTLKQTELVYFREPEVAFNINKRKPWVVPGHALHKIKRVIINRTKITNQTIEKMLERSIERYSGNKFFEIMTKEEPVGDKIVRGLFFEWDNTPRHSYRGYIINPPDKKHFDEFMETVKDEEYLFINAWNEWAEGMMLEPTEQNGHKYLKWLKEW